MPRPGAGEVKASACATRIGLNLVDLPLETLKTILSFLAPADLVHIARTSREFHALAASVLYRTVRHVFPDDRILCDQPPVDYLAGILETLATADYNYAQYMKTFILDAENGYSSYQVQQEFKYEHSAGKFLNALILAALKRTATLESFKWNVRVEISQSVLQYLSKLQTLQHLHVRLQPGPSLHSASIIRLLDSNQPTELPNTSHGNLNGVHIYHAQPPFPPQNPPGIPYYSSHGTYTQSRRAINPKPVQRLGTHRPTLEPKNFSLFSGLKSLAVLDIDSYEYIPEISACVQSCSSTIKSLSLSLSETLAAKARKRSGTEPPTNANVADDTNDDFVDQQALPPGSDEPGSSEAGTSTQNELRKERALQEKILAQVLGVASDNPEDLEFDREFDRAMMAAHAELQAASRVWLSKDDDRNFVAKMKSIVDELLSLKSSKRSRASKSARALEKLERASAKYLEAQELKGSLQAVSGSSKVQGSSTEAHNSQGVSNASPENVNGSRDAQYHDNLVKLCEDHSPPSRYPFHWSDRTDVPSDSESKPEDFTPLTAQDETVSQPKTSPVASGTSHSGNGLGVGIHSGSSGTVRPRERDDLSDIVDIEHPDTNMDSDEDDESSDETGEEGKPSKYVSTTDTEKLSAGDKGKQPVRDGPSISQNNVTGEKESSSYAQEQYLRTTRGLRLDSLSIYLIPVRPLTLAKGVDLSALKHLSLLNVGAQGPFWAMLSSANHPISLTSIHTDNVTPEFLQALGRFNGLTELFLFERSHKSKLPTLAPKTTVRIEHIRRTVLKMHGHSLRRLIVRNEDDSEWMFDCKSVMSLVRYGNKLEELMIGLNSDSLHFLMSQITSLKSLRALQVLFHSNTKFNDVTRQIRYGIVDTISQCPHLRVEYVGVCCALQSVDSDKVTQLRAGRNLDAQRSSTWDLGRIGVDDSDDEVDWESCSRIIRRDLKAREVEGVKMWRREVWAMRL